MLYVILLIAILLPLKISAQTVLSNSGAKNESTGSPISVTTDEWSLWRNPAGLTSVEHPVVSSSIRKSQSVNAFTRSALLAGSGGSFSGAIGVSSFGDDLYNESAASLGVASKIGLTSIGLRADINQLRIDGNATRRALGITIGCIAQITHRLSIGISARNINLPTWSRGQPLPVLLNTGVAFIPGDNFLVVAEVEKNTDFNPTFKGGFEYSMRKKFFFRTGFNLFPNAAFGGIGLRMWRFGFDYSLKFGYLPGYAQQMSVSLQLKK
jgi:hypothetical protein